jgi:hypothetical protein
MTRLAWVRTILVALGFVWAMLAWHAHERAIDRERSYIIDLIVRLCASDFPDSPEDRDECEIDYRTRLLNGVNVQGNLTVSGTGNTDASDDPGHAQAQGIAR